MKRGIEMKTKVISILLTLSMILPSVNFAVFADEPTVSGNNSTQEIGTSPTASVDYLSESSDDVSDEDSGTTSDEDKSEALTTGDVEISSDGSYCIKNVTVTNSVIIKSGVSANLTITDVTIKSTTVSPIVVESGATLNLHIEGENTLTAPTAHAGIVVGAQDINNFATLSIDGSGTLNVTGGNNAAGIGANKYKSGTSTNINGEIIINSGKINVATGNGGAGIGSGSGGSKTNVGCPITINGGSIIATAGLKGTAIGGGASQPNGTITINGGYVKAIEDSRYTKHGIGPGNSFSTQTAVENIFINGGSVNATFRTADNDKIQNSNNVLVKQVVLSIPSMPNKEVSKDNWTTTTDEEGKLYVYVDDETTSYAVNCDNKIYGTQDINESTELKEITGSCDCDENNSSIKLSMPESISVNKLEEEKTIRLKTNFIKSETCDFPIHNISYDYKLTETDGITEVSDTVAEISDGNLIVHYVDEEKVIRLSVTATLNNTYTYTDYIDITISGDNSYNFDISTGNIVISTNDSESVSVKVGSLEYTVPVGMDINIIQSAKQTTNGIQISQGVNPTLVLNNVNIVGSTTALVNPLKIGDSVTLTLKLVGENVIESKSPSLPAVQGISDTSKLIIEDGGNDDGEITFKSTSGAGIGGIKMLTVNSGTVNAYGGNGGAGIGGGRDGSGFDVLIKGGNVYAYGDDSDESNAAGIGGGTGSTTGTSGIGGNVRIESGYVKAVGHGTGYGIGNGGNQKLGGNISIVGGSVDATLGTVPNNDPNYDIFTDSSDDTKVQDEKYNQYLVKVQVDGISGEQNIKYSILADDETDEQQISTHTDSEGYLYLYANTGNQWIRVHKGEDTYYRYINVNTTSNTAICIQDTSVSINKFKIPGQKGDTIIDNNNDKRTIEINVPYNIILDKGVEPVVDFKGAFVKTTSLTFDESNTAEFVVISDKREKITYTVKAIVGTAPADGQADEYDIADGKIIITDNYVQCGKVRYKTNSNGYIITGETKQNTIMLDAENLPPVTFRKLSVELSNIDTPLTVTETVDITIEGECLFSSVGGNGIYVRTYGSTEVNIKSKDGNSLDNRLSVVGGVGKPAISVEYNAKLNITGITTFITAETSAAILGNGKFITDSQTYMQISETQESKIENADGESLYNLQAQMSKQFDSVDRCTYNNKEYYIGSDAILYLMVPNGTYNMTVNYNNDDYIGTAEVNGAKTEVTLYTTTVTGVLINPASISCKGGDVKFTVEGTSVSGKVKIIVKNSEDTSISYEETVTEDENGNFTATITLPENESTEDDVVYKVYYTIIKDKEEIDTNKKVTVRHNNSVCQITEFEIDGQTEPSSFYDSEDSHTITVYMPYDHTFKDYYAPSKLSFIGDSISSDVNIPIKYTVVNNEYARAYYNVTAEDGTTVGKYTIKIYKEATPVITSLKFKNPTSSAASTVKVSVVGTALGHIKNAENENNRKVYIYSDDGIEKTEAKYDLETGTYIAELNVPENESDTADKEYALKVLIGDTEQKKVNETIRVPRKERGLVGINEFKVEGQVGETEFSGENNKQIKILMPYDADITSLLPDITLEDKDKATYSPNTNQDFTKDVTYTVTAEDGVTTKEYTVHIDKQEKPIAKSIEFESPQYSSAGIVEVKINGENLENIENALNHSKTIQVSAELKSGNAQDSNITTVTAQKDENGAYIANINVPANNSDTDRVYILSVSVGGEEQTLDGEVNLVVPKKQVNQCELTDFIVDEEGQSAISMNMNNVYLYVPYNTNLNSVTPDVRHTGESYSPTGAQDLNVPIEYTIVAADGTKKTYTINVLRRGYASISNVSINKPQTFKDTDMTIDITGQFIPYLGDDEVKDVMDVVVVSRDDGQTKDVKLSYDGYSGHAIGTVTLDENDSSKDKLYDVKITINGKEQEIGSAGSITVPRKSNCEITDFRVNGQLKNSEINNTYNTIVIYMPYTTDVKSLTPLVEFDGKDYSPKGAQDFTNPVKYTVIADGDLSREYAVRVQRLNKPTITNVSVSDMPKTYKGGDITVTMSGIFNESMKVYAVSEDGNSKIECHDAVIGDVTDGFRSASASITMPENDDTENSKNYTLVFDVDGFENVSYVPLKTVTVPRRKTRTITNFYVQNQVGSADIQDKDVYVKVQYDTDISKLTPNLRIDGDSYAPEGEQNFDNETKSLVYKVSAADDVDREYTVHISRDGKPTINEVSYTSPVTFKGGLVTVGLNGIFFEDVKVYAVPISGGAKIEGKTISFEDKSATATLNIPTNYNTESEQEYRIEFVIDGFDTNYSSETKITVPRRTTRKITEFTLPDVQEGETKIDGTDIYISSPYIYDLSSVTPQISFDADEISPSADTAQDFSNLDNPVKYTLSSAADEDVTYTVHIERVGDDPYLESLTVDGQYGETEYEDDNVKLVLKSSAKLNSVEPVLQIHGDDYSPKGAQDFTDSEKNPVVYTVKNKYGVEHKYYVTITKKRSSGGNKGSSATPTPTPTETPITTVEPTNSPKPNDGNQTPNPTEMPITKHEPYISGYEENGVVQFRPDNTITRAEVAKILTVLDGDFDVNKTYANKFSDVHDGTWYQNYINFAVEKNYISGDENGLCRPEDMISRAEFASIIARYINIEPLDGEDKFTDIARLDWCKKYINALAEKGIVTGYENDEFLPDNKLTRSEAVAIINRITDRKMTPEILEKLTCPFSDVSKTHWAYNDILLAACEY